MFLAALLLSSPLKNNWGVSFTDLGPFRAIKYDKLLALEMGDKTYGWTVEMQLKTLKQNAMKKIEEPRKMYIVVDTNDKFVMCFSRNLL